MPQVAQFPVQPPFFFFLSLTREKTARPAAASMTAMTVTVSAFSAIHANMASDSFLLPERRAEKLFRPPLRDVRSLLPE